MELKDIQRIAKEADEMRKITAPTTKAQMIASEINDHLKKSRRFPEGIGISSDLRETIAQLNSAAADRAYLMAAPMMGSIVEANEAILKIADSFKIKDDILEKMFIAGGTRIGEWTRIFENLSGVAAQAHVADQFDFLAERSYLAQANLLGLDLANTFQHLAVPEAMHNLHRTSFEGFSHSYKDLIESFSQQETNIFNLPPVLTDIPTLEFFNAADLLSVTVPRSEPSKYSDTIVTIREEDSRETSTLLIDRLHILEPDWVVMLEGAKQAIRSDNPDRIRHSITSLRELVTHVLHRLSPDDELRGWSTSTDDFANNRPTRRARLNFITRNLQHDKYSHFVSADIDAVLAMIDVYQSGTHGAKTKLSDEQVVVLVTRTEAAILMLLTIDKYD